MADEAEPGLPAVSGDAGRPTSYSADAAAEVCRRVIRGETLLRIETDPAMPAVETVLEWMQDVPAFAAAYDRARGLMADVLFDEVREVALAATPGDVWVSRLRFDGLRWMAGMLAPRKYLPRVVAEAAIAEARAETDPARQGLTVIVKRFSDVTPEEEEAARLTEEGYFDRRRLRGDGRG
ncbi:MAG: hypothetical protein ACJ798_13530 [Phenylobacterium sp.]